MKLDTNLAWRQASAAVAANRDVVLAIAGVFILLPRLAFELLAPEPTWATAALYQDSGPANFEAIAQQMQAYYAHLAPWMLAMVLVETTGTLALLTLFTDHTRPTVGQAIGSGLRGALPYLAAQMLVALGFGMAGGMVLGLAMATGVRALAGLVMAGLLALLVYGTSRLALLAPVVAAERVRAPLAALGRSWRLTRGNAARILGFVALLLVVMVVVTLAVMGTLGALAALVLNAGAVRMAMAVVSTTISTLFAVYVVAVLAAIHRQLAAAPWGGA